MYKVSFSIPIYNVELFVERALLSALNQTYDNIEYLLIDDKGQDNSMNIVKSIITNHPRKKDIRIIEHSHNIGTGEVRNTAIKNAQGKYIFFMDSDDEITPDCIDILVKEITLHDVDFVASSHVKRDLFGKIYNTHIYNDLLINNGPLSVAKYRYYQNKNIYVMPWNKLYKLDFLKQNNIYCKPKHLNEDCWFTYQVIIYANSCFLSSKKTLYYTINPKSTTGKTQAQGYSIKQSQNYAETETDKCNLIKNLRKEKIYTSLLVDIMFMSIYHSYRTLISNNKNEDKEREEIVKSLLSCNFLLPARINLDLSLLRFILLYSFYRLPLHIKINIIKLSIKLDVQNFLKKWIHFP